MSDRPLVEPDERELRARTVRTGHVVDVDGPVFYGQWVGDPAGRLTIVALHGTGSSHVMWDRVAPYLARHGRVLAPDLPGFGRTPRRGRRATVPALQRLVDRFVREVTDAPAVLAGTSMGGAVAALQASRGPDTACGLVLSSSFVPPYYAGWRMPLVALGLMGERVGEAVHAGREQLLASALGISPPGPAAVAAGPDEEPEQPTVDPAETRRSNREAFASFVGYSLRPSRIRAAYAGIRCPVVQLHGEEDRNVPVAWAYAAARQYDDWDLHVYPGVAHVVKLANPTWWVQVVDDFLDRLRS